MKKIFLALPLVLAAGWAHAQAQAQAATDPESPVTAVESVPVQVPGVAPVVVTGPAATEPAQPVVPAETAAPTTPPPAPIWPVPLQLRPAGRWAGDLNLGFSRSTGNTDSLSLNLGLDATYTRPEDKLSLSAMYLESRARSEDNGVSTTSVTALQWRLGGRYDRNITPTEFGFAGLEFSHDRVLQLDLRSVISSGLGRHVYKDLETQWDVYAGLSYREDYYSGSGVEVDGATRTRYDTTETLFGQESTHQIGNTTRFKQKLVVYPALLKASGTRATLDAGLQVDINKTLSLSVKLQGRYDSQAPAPAEKYDLLLITGLSVKLGS